MRKVSFVNNEIYHVYNRGVEKREIFSDEKDYFRFIHDIFEFNDQAPTDKFLSHLNTPPTDKEKGPLRKPRKLLVELLCFCAMPNHYHFLLRQVSENGITKFMRKFGTGYTNYFNNRYERVGPLFQGKFKSVHIETDQQLFYIPHYIHLNPLDLFFPNWKKEKLENVKEALDRLNSYRWSSYLDYINRTNFPSVTQRDFLFQIFGSRTSENCYENNIYRERTYSN